MAQTGDDGIERPELDGEARAAKRELLAEPVAALRMGKGMRVSELVSGMKGMSIQARAIGQCAEVLDGMYTDERRPTVLVGLAGDGVGFLLGTTLGLTYGPGVFEITAKAMIRWEPSLLVFACILAPLFAVVASVIPTMIAVTYDPAATLREE